MLKNNLESRYLRLFLYGAPSLARSADSECCRTLQIFHFQDLRPLDTWRFLAAKCDVVGKVTGFTSYALACCCAICDLSFVKHERLNLGRTCWFFMWATELQTLLFIAYCVFAGQTIITLRLQRWHHQYVWNDLWNREHLADFCVLLELMTTFSF